MYVFLQCVAEAVVAKGVRGLAELVPGGGYLFDVANEAHKRLRDRKRMDQIREEVVAVAAAGIEDVRKVAEQVVNEVAPNASPSEKAALELYLTQVPGAVRQSFRRADDPSGKSVPDQFALAEPGDLARRLPSRLPKFRTGDPLPGRPGWVLGELLGSGGFGEVWLARNPTLAALKGAVKFGIDPQARERLLRHEGGLVSRVMEEGRHPNIVPLLDAHLEGETPWLMYEYVGGGDLGALIHSWQALAPADRVTRAVAALRTLAAAVGHFHRLAPPLVHRDLKPANILVSTDRGATTVRVADFGIGGLAADAALAAEASRRSSGYLGSQLWGSHTPLYASPQQQRGEKPDPKDDVHALGVTGFQMLTGRLDAAPGADFARTLRRQAVPEPLIELLGDCAAHDPAHRPRDAAALADRLTTLDAAPSAPPPEPMLVVGCPGCGVSLRFRAGATALRCTRCKQVFNPSAAAAPPPVVEAKLSPPPPPPPSRAEPVRATRTRDDDRTRTRRDDDRPRRKERRPEPGGIPPALIVGGVLGAVFVLVVLVMAFRGSGTPPGQPPQATTTPPAAANNPAPFPAAGTVVPGTPQPAPKGKTPIRPVRSFPRPAMGKAEHFRYSPDGTAILGVDPDGFVTVIMSDNGGERLSYASNVKGHRPAFFPDGQTLVSAKVNDKGQTELRLVPVQSGIPHPPPLEGMVEKPVAMAVSPSSTWVAAGGDGGTVRVWNIVNHKGNTLNVDGGVKAFPFPGGVRSIAFDPSGKYLAAGGGSTVRVWAVTPNWTGDQTQYDAGGTVFSVGFTPDGKKLVAGTRERGFRTWDVGNTPNPTSPADGKLANFTRVAYSTSTWGGRFAAVDAAGKFGFWDGSAGSPVGGFRGWSPSPTDPAALDIAFHKNGDVFAVAQADGTVMIWHLFHGLPAVRLSNHRAPVVAVAWSPNGTDLATVTPDGRVRICTDANIGSHVGPPVEVQIQVGSGP